MIKLQPYMMLGKKPSVSPIPNVIIAGGAIRGWFNGEISRDIDVFGQTKEDLANFQTQQLQGFTLVFASPNANTYKKDDTIVQLIHKIFPKSVEDLFDSFDYHLCQFAYVCHDNNPLESPTYEILTTLEAVLSTTRKHLSVNKFNPDFAVDSLRRAFKYYDKGYRPCDGTILDIANNLVRLTDEQIHNSITISPGGGRTVLRYD